MALGCGTTLVKYILFVFNFLIALGGIALVTLGIISLITTNDYHEIFKDNSPAFASVSLIVFGSVVFLIAFFGCCGAIRESHCMTMTYASILLVIIIAQLVIAVLIFVKRDDFKEDIIRIMGEVFKNHADQANMETINAIQRGTECCGFNGPSSWTTPLPASCCPAGDASCNMSNAFQQKCENTIREFINGSSQLLGWVAIGVAAVELVALIFACCLGNNIRNAERRYA